MENHRFRLKIKVLAMVLGGFSSLQVARQRPACFPSGYTLFPAIERYFIFQNFPNRIFVVDVFHFKVENQLVSSKDLLYHYYRVSYYNTLGYEFEIESDDVHRNEKNPRQKFESEIFGK